MPIELYGTKFQVECPLRVHLALYAHPEKRIHVSDAWLEAQKLTRADLEGPDADWMFLRAAMQCAYGKKTRWVWHIGMDQIGLRWCTKRRLCIVGPTRVTKSYFFGSMMVLDWLADPGETTWFIYSTSIDALRGRVWKSVGEHWNYLESTFPWVKEIGKIKQSSPPALKSRDVGIETGIIAIAMDDKIKTEEDLNARIGTHSLKVRVAGDEIQGLPAVVLKLEGNLGGSKYYKEAVWGNFGGERTALGIAAQPPDDLEQCPEGWTKGGYEGWRDFAQRTDSIDLGREPKPEEWTSRNPDDPSKPFYHVMWLDGLRTPSVLHPDGPAVGDKLYGHFMLGLSRINEYVQGTYSWWKMIRSAPMPVGDQEVCLSDAVRIQYKVEAPVIWLKPDWRYSYGADGGRLGDPNALCCVRSGTMKSGELVIEFGWVDEFSPEATRDVDLQICQWMIKKLESASADKSLLAVEGAVTSNLSSLWDTLDRTWKAPGKFHRISTQHKSFPEKPLFVNEGNRTQVSKYYAHVAAFMWLMPREFARAGMLRNLTDAEILTHLSLRKVYPESDPVEIQAKETAGRPGPGKFRDFKDEIGQSPNKTDAFTLALLHQRLHHGVHPGAPVTVVAGHGEEATTGRRMTSKEVWKQKAAMINAQTAAKHNPGLRRQTSRRYGGRGDFDWLFPDD